MYPLARGARLAIRDDGAGTHLHDIPAAQGTRFWASDVFIFFHLWSSVWAT